MSEKTAIGMAVLGLGLLLTALPTTSAASADGPAAGGPCVGFCWSHEDWYCAGVFSGGNRCVGVWIEGTGFEGLCVGGSEYKCDLP